MEHLVRPLLRRVHPGFPAQAPLPRVPPLRWVRVAASLVSWVRPHPAAVGT